jgi:OOP family OmpA-OmpF porin
MNSKSFKRPWLPVAAAFLLGITGPVLAQGYIGAGAGITTIDVCDGIGGPGVSCDDEDTGLKIFGGYKFSPNLAVEGAWVDLGEASLTDGVDSATVGVDGFEVAAVGIWPINPKWNIFGKLGVYMWDASFDSTFGSVSDDGTERLGLRAEWERFNVDVGVDSVDVDFLSVGIQFNF